MPLQTQFMTFFISPFSELSASAELNNFLKSHRIINVEKRLIDGERGTGWVFLVEYTDVEGGKSAYTMSSKVDWRDVLNPSQFAVYDFLRKTRKEIGDKTKIPLYGIFSNEQLALMAQNPREPNLRKSARSAGDQSSEFMQKFLHEMSRF